MKIFPLGVGNAFTKRFYHNNFLFDFDGEAFLVDCGTSLRFSLKEAGIPYADLHNVFISHCHFDHIGGLEELITHRLKENFTTKVYVLRDMYEDVLSVLAPGLGLQQIEEFCEFILLDGRTPYQVNGFTIELLPTTGLHIKNMLSTGARITQPDGTQILYSSDIKNLMHSPFKSVVTRNTRLILQDISFTKNGAHSTFEEVIAYYPREVQHYIVAMHYDDNIEDFYELIEKSPIRLARQHQWIHV